MSTNCVNSYRPIKISVDFCYDFRFKVEESGEGFSTDPLHHHLLPLDREGPEEEGFKRRGGFSKDTLLKYPSMHPHHQIFDKLIASLITLCAGIRSSPTVKMTSVARREEGRRKCVRSPADMLASFSTSATPIQAEIIISGVNYV